MPSCLLFKLLFLHVGNFYPVQHDLDFSKSAEEVSGNLALRQVVCSSSFMITGLTSQTKKRSSLVMSPPEASNGNDTRSLQFVFHESSANVLHEFNKRRTGTEGEKIWKTFEIQLLAKCLNTTRVAAPVSKTISDCSSPDSARKSKRQRLDELSRQLKS